MNLPLFSGIPQIFLANETKREAYKKMLKKPNVTNKQKLRILEILEVDDLSNSEISSYTRLPINIVTARNYSLRQAGFIFESIKRKCRITGHDNVQTWTIYKKEN